MCFIHSVKSIYNTGFSSVHKCVVLCEKYYVMGLT